jgi:hypothetical protein
MIYCHQCAKKVKDDVTVCPDCGEPISPALKEGEVRPLVQALHKRTNYYRNLIDRGMSFIVIGSTLLIIGLIFYFLSFKTITDTATGTSHDVLNPQSSNFYVFLVGVGAGGILLLIGLSLAITFALLRRHVRYDVESIRANKSAQVGPIPSIFVVMGKAIAKFFKELVWKIHRHFAKKSPDKVSS